MKCPVCKSHDYVEMGLQATGFSEDIVTCKICGSIWSINHGMSEVVKDAQKNSFMAATSENVEADDYSWAV
jgi:transcription elongation factor Elf1